jgi:hypothetical protein
MVRVSQCDTQSETELHVHLGAITNHSHVCAFMDHLPHRGRDEEKPISAGTMQVQWHLGLAERDHKVARWDLILRSSVQPLRLKEQAGVVVADAGEQEALGLGRTTREDHLDGRHTLGSSEGHGDGASDLQARCVGKVGLRRLGVVVTTVSHRAVGAPNGEPADIEFVP